MVPLVGHYEYVGPGEGLNARPLRDNADYRRWWLGNLASSTGDQLVMVAFPLMVLLLTKSAFQAGLVASLSALPFIVLSLPVGELVDRVSRRLVLITSSSVSLLAHASIAASYWCGVLTTTQLYTVAFINGCAFVVFLIAQQAVLPVIVSTSELPAATSLAETVERLAAILGPPLGAYLFFSSSAATPFAINAVSFAAITLAVARVKAHLGPFPEARSRDHPIALAVGGKTVFSNPLLRDLTLINARMYLVTSLLRIENCLDERFLGRAVGFAIVAMTFSQSMFECGVVRSGG
ncbi:MFS transporter [Mycolicibacterium sp. YH-1]|uniref:MFS transporter n=1 Tax=Mycolicibacterium sp. YH-1 TaxID=2908837 RepID=UPI001F4C2E0E|nr:MFS transporter [Mycolicibacterium sp. YH-1]UNB54564.1 MFS transporter [Mycolicibacterium sp. YH-1]